MLHMFGFSVFVLLFCNVSADQVVKKSTTTRSCTPYTSAVGLEGYGLCRNPGIVYGYNIGNSNQFAYAPADQGQFPHASSPDIATVESYICDRLSSTCNASFSGITACRTAFNLLSGLSGDWAVAAWNQALGVGVYEDCTPDNQPDVTTTITVTVTPSQSPIAVSGSGISQATTVFETITEQTTATMTETSTELGSNTRSPLTATVTVTTTLSVSSSANISTTRTSTRQSSRTQSSSTQRSSSSQGQTTQNSTTTVSQPSSTTSVASTTSSRGANDGSGGGSPFDPPFNSAAEHLPQFSLPQAFLMCFLLVVMDIG